MKSRWTILHGILVAGYHVAAGGSRDYPYGALERQIPIFKERGLDLCGYFYGTLNVNIQPYVFQLVKPEFTFHRVEWTDLHPPEDFSFSRSLVVYEGEESEGWLYYPHPETKLRNFQDPSLLEVIARQIPNIKYGDKLEVLVNPRRIKVTQRSQPVMQSTVTKK